MNKRSVNSSSRNKTKIRRNMTCELCKREKKRFEELEIHHIDGHIKNNADKNMMVLCGENTKQNCHAFLELQISKGIRHTLSKLASGELSVKNKTDYLKKAIDYSSGSPEMQVTDQAEMPYRNWLIALLKNIEEYPRKQAINSGAEICGINPQTARRYYNKLVSDNGPLQEYKNEFKVWMVRLKKDE